VEESLPAKEAQRHGDKFIQHDGTGVLLLQPYFRLAAQAEGER
jgi:hypothetical protein